MRRNASPTIEDDPNLASSFNMEKIIMANNKHLNRYEIEPKNQGVNEFVFEDLVVEETDLENPELDEIQQKARKALGREEAAEEE